MRDAGRENQWFCFELCLKGALYHRFSRACQPRWIFRCFVHGSRRRVQVRCPIVHTVCEYLDGRWRCRCWRSCEWVAEDQFRPGTSLLLQFSTQSFTVADRSSLYALFYSQLLPRGLQFGASVLDVMELPLSAFDDGDLKEGFDLFMLMQVRIAKFPFIMS